MAYLSILYPDEARQMDARHRPWLIPGGSAKLTPSYIWRGNKLVSAKQSDAPDDAAPQLYRDLNMDRIEAAIFPADSDAPLREVFRRPCLDEATIAFRQQILLDLQRPDAHDALLTFRQSMELARRLAEYGAQSHYGAQADKYMLDAVAVYCRCVGALCARRDSLALGAQGLARFLDALAEYERGAEFRELRERTECALRDLEAIAYRLRVSGGCVEVAFDAEPSNYSADLAQDFDLCGRWGVEAGSESPEIQLFRQVDLCPLEALVMDALKQRHAAEFRAAHTAADQARAALQPFVFTFCDELKFYFKYIEFMDLLQARGCPFAYPVIPSDGRTVQLDGLYDLALAIDVEPVVPNDFALAAGERGAIITGANQGGKTTFARSFGQAAILASMGLPVPCRRAQLPAYSSAFSQFSEAEDSTIDHGKLQQELLRLKPILRQAGAGSLVILNELFSSTTDQDATDMGNRVLCRLMDAGAHVLCVTHCTGLGDARAVSLVAQVEHASGQRLFTIVRAKADGRARATDIAARYHLSHREIEERIAHGV